MNARRAHGANSGAKRSAFTLLEVSIAMALFFMATFAILGLVSSTLRNARALQETEVDASMLASELSATNKLYEAVDSGDFGDAYKDYSWTREIRAANTNGLFEVTDTQSPPLPARYYRTVYP